MITKMPTAATLKEWKATYDSYKDRLKPNRISGADLLNYLTGKYVLTEITEQDALDIVRDNIMLNEFYREKLPPNTLPDPRAFYLENAGDGQKFFLPQNADNPEIWGGKITRIFVGIDICSGFYTAEGSTMLHDELNAIRGLDQNDLQNYVVVAQYIEALERFDMADKVLGE